MIRHDDDDDFAIEDSVNYKQWMHTDRTNCSA